MSLPASSVARLMVSGTRAGMTVAQKDAFADVLHKHAAVQQLLHGDCIGADAQCGSGTWAVIREARRKGVPLVVVFPNGETS